MKRTILSCVVASGLMFSTQALAETSSIDLFVGDFMGIATVDTVKLAANSMIDKAISDNANQGDVQDVLKALSDYGIDYKKDIGVVTVAANEKGDFCLAVDAKKSLSDAVKKYVEKEKESLKTKDHKGVTVYASEDSTAALVSEKRLVACDNGLDILPIIDNAMAAKPKLLKDRDSALYKAYSATAKSSDVRIGAKMTPTMRKSYGHYSLDDGAEKKVSVGDVQSASLSIDFSKGLNIEVIAQSKAADKAKMGAEILTKQVGGLLSDPAMEQLGLGFLNSAVKFSAEKSSLKGTLALTNDQITQIAMLFTELTAGAAPAK